MYRALLLIDPDGPVTIENLKAELAEFYESGSGQPGSIQLIASEVRLAWPGFMLAVNYSDALHVIEESREIAEQFAQTHQALDRIQLCRTRFEIAGDDDPFMEHFNDYLFVIEAAQRLGTIYAFDPTSCEFI